MTQVELAYRAGVGEATIRRIETGRHAPRLATLKVLATVLEIDVEVLLGRAS